MSDAANLARLFDALPYPVFAKNSRHQWVYGNRAFAELIGDADFLGKDDRAVFASKHVDVFWKEDARVFAGQESVTEAQIGDDVFMLTRKFPVTLADGSPGVIGILIASEAHMEALRETRQIWRADLRDKADLAAKLHTGADLRAIELESRLSEVEIERKAAITAAHTDAATGLRNRLGFEEDLSATLERFESEGRKFGLAFLDVDHFKRINDRLGHAVGDLVLKVVGKRLCKLPDVISVGRMGGDEFAIITERPSISLDDLGHQLELARQYVFKPITDRGRQIQLSGSVGVSIYPVDATCAQDLKRHADLALLSAKRSGRSRIQIFDDAIKKTSDRRREIERALPDAIARHALTPVFQPIVCSRTRKIKALEVLARWTHPQLGPITPTEFVKVASEIGLVSELDAAVFDVAVCQAKPWLAAGLIESLSFNISPVDVIAQDFAARFLAKLEAAEVEPNQICMELIESSIVEDLEAARQNLQTLSDAGVSIALDDYGTGFSNLRALLDLPLHRLKIDQSLVADIEDKNQMLDLLVSITQLARTLKMDVVAEGIETEFQAVFVEGAGSELMQGYLFSKPLDAKAMEAWLREQRAVAA